jgi:hypothetical protein
MWESEKPKHTEPPSLAEALDFTDEELALNRDGQLSERQLDELFSEAHQYRSLEMLVYVIAALIGIVIILDGIRRGDTVSSRIAILGVFGALAYGLIFIIHRHRVHHQHDADGAVEAVQGQVSLNISGTSSSTTYTVRTADGKFNVGREVFFAFKNGDPYALYYAPRTRRVLSAEWLREA